MTRETQDKLRETTKRVLISLLTALIASLTTHLIDVVAVKDRVDEIRREQIENSKWRIESQARIKIIEDRLAKYIDVDLPSVLDGQRVTIKRIEDLEREVLDHERRQRIREKARQSNGR